MRRALAALLLLAIPASAGAQSSWPERLGPYWIGDGDARIRPSLILQQEGRGQTAGESDFAADFRLRRIRPILRGSFLDGRVTATLHLEVTPSNPELIDAWVDAQPLEGMRLRVGQLKSPFTRYYQRSVTEMAVDWPLTSRWFGGERQLGLMVHGEHEASGVSYALGVFTGQNRRSAFERQLARVYGERLGNPSSFAAPASSEEPHPEVTGRLGHEASTGELRYQVSFSASYDARPTPRRDFALRLAPELLASYGDWSVTAIGYLGAIETRSGALALGAVGLLAEVAWRADRHLELVLRYGRVHLLPELLEDARQHAEAMRPTSGALDDWRAQYAGLGDAHAQHELALAANVLIIGRSLALQVDLAWLREERVTRATDDLRVRTQLQLAF